MGSHQMGTPSGLGGLRLQHQRPVGPGRQRRLDEAAGRQHRREVDQRTCGIEIGDQRPQAVRHLLAATHTGDRRHRDVEGRSGLVDRPGQ